MATTARLDQSFAESPGDGMRAVAEAQPSGDIVDDGLDRALRVSELLGDLLGIESLGDEPEHVDLALGQAVHGQASGREHLSLQLPDLVQQSTEQIGR